MARAQKLHGHLIVLEALSQGGPAVSTSQIDSAVVAVALGTIVVAHREQVGVPALD